MIITPYSATSIMLYNLEKELLSAKWLTFSENAAAELTLQDFQRICDEVKDQALIYKDSIIATAPKASSNTNNLSNQNKKDYPTRRNAPPKGVDHDEYVKKWKEYKDQTTPAGTCAFCNEKGCMPHTCLYLNPEKRPESWKPNTWLWCYKPTVRGDKSNMALQTTGNAVANQSNMALTTDYNDKTEDFSYGFVGMMLAAYSCDNQPRRHPWLADTEASKTLVTDLQDIIDYKPFTPGDQEYTYATSSGEQLAQRV